MFGKDRSKYVQRDVLSDDEDMEVDATALEMEEHRRSISSTTLNSWPKFLLILNSIVFPALA
jgi:hypothetical protein